MRYTLHDKPALTGTDAVARGATGYNRAACAVIALCAVFAPAALAQTPLASDAEPPAVTVTATSVAQPAFDTSAAVDVVSGRTLKEGQRQVNLSETLARVPGLNIGDRNNYAQDLQISSRGFGARSSFGVRGIRLYADGIPASMPDGSGQVSHFSLSSAERVEVLRGPFSALHGNAAGGVIAIFSEEAPQGLRITPSASYGSFRTWRLGTQIAGTVNPASSGTATGNNSSSGGIAVGYTLDASQFATDGTRDHNAARRETENARLKFRLSDTTTLAVTYNRVNMPNAQDALGLSRAEYTANPDQATPTALQFNTRKSTYQAQGGAVLEHAFSNANQVRISAYYGERKIEQYQSIPVATQAAITSPGGVIDLDRGFYGFDARWVHKGFARDGAYHVTAGVSREIQNELRRGYLNFVGTQLGVPGALRRNEDNRVTNFSQFVQGEWQVRPSLKLSAGARHSAVRFNSRDNFITGANGDDSGAITYRATTPAAGAVWSITERINLYATAGRGFETPTFNELAYKPVGSGLNFALKPATSRHAEAGVKAQFEGGTVSAALFRADTVDEIVTLTNAGGRAIFQNAGRTARRGVEIAVMKRFATGAASSVTVNGAYTRIDATYRDGFLTCLIVPCAVPNVPVAAGNALPGVPRESLYLEALWRMSRGGSVAGSRTGTAAQGTAAAGRAAAQGAAANSFARAGGFFSQPYAAIELRRVSQMFADDRNSDAAEGYTLVNLRAGLEQRTGQWSVSEFLRLDNIGNKQYAGSVIVNETNGRFFEPAARRNWTVGISAALRFE